MSIKGKALATGLTVVTLTAGIWIWKSSLVSSCDPYVLFVKPDGIFHYYRYDGSDLKWGGNNIPDGRDAGQGGSDHHVQFYLGGMIIPVYSGECPPACGPDGYPQHIDPAPYRDVLIEHQPPPPNPPRWLCDVYRDGNGPRAKPCPSNQTLAQYSTSVKAMIQWKLDPNCGHFPTPTPTGGTPIPTPIPSNTPTPTKAASATPTPTICVPKIITVMVTATRTPHIGPAPTKTP